MGRCRVIKKKGTRQKRKICRLSSAKKYKGPKRKIKKALV